MGSAGVWGVRGRDSGVGCVGGCAAADPEEAGEVDGVGGSGGWVEGVGGVDPGGDFAFAEGGGEEGEGEGGAAGAVEADHLGDGAYGEAALKEGVE